MLPPAQLRSFAVRLQAFWLQPVSLPRHARQLLTGASCAIPRPFFQPRPQPHAASPPTQASSIPPIVWLPLTPPLIVELSLPPLPVSFIAPKPRRSSQPQPFAPFSHARLRFISLIAQLLTVSVNPLPLNAWQLLAQRQSWRPLAPPAFSITQRLRVAALQPVFGPLLLQLFALLQFSAAQPAL